MEFFKHNSKVKTKKPVKTAYGRTIQPTNIGTIVNTRTVYAPEESEAEYLVKFKGVRLRAMKHNQLELA